MDSRTLCPECGAGSSRRSGLDDVRTFVFDHADSHQLPSRHTARHLVRASAQTCFDCAAKTKPAANTVGTTAARAGPCRCGRCAPIRRSRHRHGEHERGPNLCAAAALPRNCNIISDGKSAASIPRSGHVWSGGPSQIAGGPRSRFRDHRRSSGAANRIRR